MALLVVAERFPPDRGGLSVATARIARQAQARGETVHVASLSAQVAPGIVTALSHEELTEHKVGILPRDDETLSAFSAHLRELVTENAIDLVHSIYAGRGAYAATLVARELGVSSIVSLRGNDIDRGLYRASDLPLLQATLRSATLVSAVSQKLTQVVTRVFEREVHHVSNSVDADAFFPVERDPSLAVTLGLGTEPVVSFVGELREKKGMRFLLPAFADVLRRRKLSLLLVGGVREDAESALAAFREAAPAAAEAIRIVPYERNPDRSSKLLALADLVVFPSLWEGTPNALLETMAAARPVLATRVGGHVDLIEHGVTGALFDLADLGRLPLLIEEMLDLPAEKRNELGRRAREFVREKHAPRLESHAYAALYARARAERR